MTAQETLPGQNPPSIPAGGSQEDFAAPTAFIPREGISRATFSVDYSYVGSGQAKFQGANLGNSEGQSVNASLAGAVALNDKWFVPLGISSANFFLDSVGRELDYQRIGQTVQFDPAPYAQAGLKYRF